MLGRKHGVVERASGAAAAELHLSHERCYGLDNPKFLHITCSSYCASARAAPAAAATPAHPKARRAATVALTLEEKLAGQKRIKTLKSQGNEKRRSLFEAQYK
jgi:hypothetical protein